MINEPYTFTSDWFSINIPIWESIFDHYKPKKILEIGSYEGRSTVWMAEKIKSGEIWCVDTWKGGEEHERIEMRAVERRFDKNLGILIRKFPDIQFTARVDPSYIALADYVCYQHEYDLIYIDGSHQAPDVLCDLCISFPLLKSGGVMICDDYLWSWDRNPRHAPKMAIDAFINCYAEKLDVLNLPLQQIVMVKK